MQANPIPQMRQFQVRATVTQPAPDDTQREEFCMNLWIAAGPGLAG